MTYSGRDLRIVAIISKATKGIGMFHIKERGSTVGREILGGVTTFMAMSYIIFVQIGLLGNVCGMDHGGVMMATCFSAAAASILMGLLANYPIALAPGMGENFFFAFTIVPAAAAWGFGVPWQVGMAMVCCSGVVFLLLSTVGFRSRLLNSIPDSLKSGIAAGIGLFIVVIGFNYGNLTRAGGALLETPGLGDNQVAWLTLIGLGVTMLLMAFHVRGAILLGILVTTGVAMAMGQVSWCGSPVDMPSGIEETAGGFIPGFEGLWNTIWSQHAAEALAFVFILLFMDMFDTVGTLVGVSRRAGLMKDGRLPGAERALAADAAGTVIGAVMGTTTVTSYIESVTGVESGARTGLAAIVTGLLMAAAVFFQPLCKMIGGGVEIAPGVIKYPLVAPALIIVGAMMLRVLMQVNWDDVTEYVPACLTMIAMPLAYSISAGIAIGFISYAFGKLVTGRVKQCSLLVYIFAILFVVLYVVKTML